LLIDDLVTVSMSGSFAKPLPRAFGWRGFAVALPHQVGDIHLQLLSKVNKGSGLLGARRTDVGRELP
jgi:hypothetical protein